MAALPPHVPNPENFVNGSYEPVGKGNIKKDSKIENDQSKQIQHIGVGQDHERHRAPQLKDIKSMHNFKLLSGDAKAIIKDEAKKIASKAQGAVSKIMGLASGVIDKLRGKEKSDEWIVRGDDLKWQTADRDEEARSSIELKDTPKEQVFEEVKAETPPLKSDVPAPKKEASKEDLDLLAAKMKEIREKRAERKNLKEELKNLRQSDNPALQKAVQESDAKVKEGRYKQEVEEVKFGGLYKVGKYEMVDGKKVYNAPKSEISLDNIEKVAANLIQANDRAGLRKLCISLFMGPHGTRGVHSMVPEIDALKVLLNDPNSDLSGAEKLIRGGAEKWRSEFKPALAQTKKKGDEIMKKLSSSPPDWAKDPEAWVEISHGGGAEYIRDFVEGRSDGYKLENFGTGLQVSPNYNDRDNMYAQRVYQTFDSPAIFKGRIQAKYLQLAPNGYEAGLTPENIKHLENVTIERAPFTGGLSSPNYAALEREYGSDLVKNVRDAYQNIKNHDKKPYTDEELKKIGADYPAVEKYSKTEKGELERA